jgi:hypothetical protein
MNEPGVFEQWNEVGEILFRDLLSCRDFLQRNWLLACMNGKVEHEANAIPAFG